MGAALSAGAVVAARAQVAALACAVCGGDADSDQARAARVGVMVLMAVVVGVLTAIGLTLRRWSKRARALEAK